VLLTATLDTGERTLPVRIRNLSERGALIDARVLPTAGTRLKLMRGRLTAVGELAWESDGQGGLTFDRPIVVASWVQKLGHSGQQRVDATVAALRENGTVPRNLQRPASQDSLPVLSAALDQICERLAGISGISVEMGEELVKLDTIAQSLRHLATGRRY